MTTSAKTARVFKSFEKACRVEGRLTNIDWSAKREAFEEEYEALLSEFYNLLLDIDHMIDCRFPTETPLRAHFKSLLENGRRIDSLWDRYHRDRLGRNQFSRLLHTIPSAGKRFQEALSATRAPSQRHN